MLATKDQLISGIAAYIENDILPKMEDQRALQIVASIAIKAIKANDALIDTVLERDIVKTMLKKDESGRYELDPLLNALRDSIDEYGCFPLTIPPIPLIAPSGGVIKLNAADISSIRRKIEAAGGVPSEKTD